MPPSSYADVSSNDFYNFRIYMSEPEGAVLGANFMNNYNIIFDAEGGRLGFAISKCEYDRSKAEKGQSGSDVDGEKEMVDGADTADGTEGEMSTNTIFLVGLGGIFIIWILIILCLKLNAEKPGDILFILLSF
jgi:hypothetical protein